MKKPWYKMTKTEFLAAVKAAIIAGRHQNPPTTYITNGRLVTPKTKKP